MSEEKRKKETDLDNLLGQIIVEPENLDLRLSLAGEYFRTGAFGQAVIHYRIALSLDPTNCDAHDYCIDALRNLREEIIKKTKNAEVANIVRAQIGEQILEIFAIGQKHGVYTPGADIEKMI